jgi:uncharacterized protein (TIGR00369 family)
VKAFDEAYYRERVNAFPFVRRMGIRLLSAKGGESVMECRMKPGLMNTGGTLHGGVMGALVDMSVATALRSVIPLSTRMTTIEYKVNFLKPVPDGTITARGTILRLGRTIAVGSTDVRNERGEAVAFGSATFYLLGEGESGVPAPSGIIERSPKEGRSGEKARSRGSRRRERR